MSRMFLVLGLLGLVSITAAAGAASPPDQVDQWIRDLASSDFQTRERATKALVSAGKAALAVLEREQAASSDPEVKRRLEHITTIIRAQNPPVELVLELPERPVVLGITESFQAKLWFINKSDKPVVVCQPVDGSMHKQRDPSYLFHLYGSTGHEIARMPWFGCGNVNPLRTADFITLKPGEKVEVMHREGSFGRLDVNYFKVAQAGTYTLKAIYQMAGSGQPGGIPLGRNQDGVDALMKKAHVGTLVSKPVKVEVIAAPSADQLLRKLEKHEHHDISRADSLQALGKTHDPRAVPLLLANLRDKDAALRLASAAGLESFQQKRVIGALIHVLGDRDLGVRYRAFRSLNKLTGVNNLGYIQPADVERWQEWFKANRDKFMD